MKISIKPLTEDAQPQFCPTCHSSLVERGILWQGLHVLKKYRCSSCNSEIVKDIPLFYSANFPFTVNRKKNILYGPKNAQKWLGTPLTHSLQNPMGQSVTLRRIVRAKSKQITMINCLDSIYGHSLCKLLAFDQAKKENPDEAIGLIIPKNLEWMAPADANEIWVVDLPLQAQEQYFTHLEQQIFKNMEDYERVYLFSGSINPTNIDIKKYTQIHPYSEIKRNERIVTFIWRTDANKFRMWCPIILTRILRKLRLISLLNVWQYVMVIILFWVVKKNIADCKFIIAGQGKTLKFPKWIQDSRSNQYSDKSEKEACAIYAQSTVIIGIHGSHMLLPSAHANVIIDMIPSIYCSNAMDDLIINEIDPQKAVYRYRNIPMTFNMADLSVIITNIIREKKFSV